MEKLSTRSPLPPDFPDTISLDDNPSYIALLIGRALMRVGETLDSVGRVYIAYPQKDPLTFPDHFNAAAWASTYLQRYLSRAAPQVEWVLVRSLVERRHLDRSGEQGVLHTLTGRQVYAWRTDKGDDVPLPPAGGGKSIFILADKDFSQGTTLANLYSYITQNGGTVAAVACHGYAQTFAQRDKRGHFGDLGLADAFTEASRNNGRLTQLAGIFSASAAKEGKKWSPQYCLEAFSDALALHGHSPFALTDGECDRIAYDCNPERGGSISFLKLLQQLAQNAPR